jgi:hypothetical protein
MNYNSSTIQDLREHNNWIQSMAPLREHLTERQEST